MQREERFEQANRVVRIGFGFTAFLMVMKLLAGHFGRSEAVFADGVESACDFVAMLTTMVALSVGRKPYDEAHPYGHGKAENISAILIALVIILTGAGILVKAVITMLKGHYEAPEAMAVAAAFITIGVKDGLYRYSQRTGSRLQSPAILAVAKDHRKDAITSIATLIGVTGAFFGLSILDPLAAALTSFFIFHIGYVTFSTAAADLMDAQAPHDLIGAIAAVAEEVDGVESVHEIRGRRSGQYLIIDLKLDMNPEMTVKQSHAIATYVKKRIFDCFPNVGDVMIHINPHQEEHEDLIRL